MGQHVGLSINGRSAINFSTTSLRKETGEQRQLPAPALDQSRSPRADVKFQPGPAASSGARNGRHAQRIENFHAAARSTSDDD